MGATADAQKDARTLFVRGVSFGVDEAGLEQVFSAVGPIKQCFLVRQKGDAHHKGFGFVQFALQEDAARAVQELNGHAIAGRKLLVSGLLAYSAESICGQHG
jgi:nucleolar protein 4